MAAFPGECAARNLRPSGKSQYFANVAICAKRTLVDDQGDPAARFRKVRIAVFLAGRFLEA